MKRLLGSQYRRPTTDAIGGIPVDSEYVIFIIDTSGSMFNYVWPTLLKKIEETLNIYPKVKGFQVMSDEGVYMFSTYRGKWLPDTPVQRKAVIDRLRNWNAFSNSSPVEGIVEAIRTYYSKEKKISLYVFGDEFTGSSIDSVVKTVDMINREDKTGQRRVRIHAIGFPGATGRASVHERAIRDADAHPLRPQRRHLRGDRQVMRLFHGCLAMAVALLAGCMTTRFEPKLDLPPPLVVRIPAVVGIYMSPEFRTRRALGGT